MPRSYRRQEALQLVTLQELQYLVCSWYVEVEQGLQKSREADILGDYSIASRLLFALDTKSPDARSVTQPSWFHFSQASKKTDQIYLCISLFSISESDSKDGVVLQWLFQRFKQMQIAIQLVALSPWLSGSLASALQFGKPIPLFLKSYEAGVYP